MRHLITFEDIGRLARPCSCSPDIAEKYIDEAERCDIRFQLGDANFKAVFDACNDARYKDVMEGGYFTDSCGKERYMEGLRRTLAYYAYARIVRNSFVRTRYAFVEKQDEYSRSADLKARQSAADESCSIADSFMVETLAYIKTRPDLFPDTCGKRVQNNRMAFKIIGK